MPKENRRACRSELEALELHKGQSVCCPWAGIENPPPPPPTKKDGYRPDKQGVASASISALFSERYGKASADGGADLPLHNSLSGGLSIIGTSYEIEDDAIFAAH